MANRDSAFLWETEALRSAQRPERPTVGPSRHNPDDWLSLREASEVTGVPIGTIRKWARHENIPSYLEDSPDGELRKVSLAGINDWADALGRDIEDETLEEEALEVDLTSEEFSRPDDETQGEPDIPEGTMLVPLDAWNKMLNQLGNLHEAGQQLAEARERAAKAETEATFLKERLSSMRAELEEARAGGEAPEPAQDTEEDPAPDLSVSHFTRAKARELYERWRARRG